MSQNPNFGERFPIASNSNTNHKNIQQWQRGSLSKLSVEEQWKRQQLWLEQQKNRQQNLETDSVQPLRDKEMEKSRWDQTESQRWNVASPWHQRNSQPMQNFSGSIPQSIKPPLRHESRFQDKFDSPGSSMQRHMNEPQRNHIQDKQTFTKNSADEGVVSTFFTGKANTSATSFGAPSAMNTVPATFSDTYNPAVHASTTRTQVRHTQIKYFSNLNDSVTNMESPKQLKHTSDANHGNHRPSVAMATKDSFVTSKVDDRYSDCSMDSKVKSRVLPVQPVLPLDNNENKVGHFLSTTTENSVMDVQDLSVASIPLPPTTRPSAQLVHADEPAVKTQASAALSVDTPRDCKSAKPVTQAVPVQAVLPSLASLTRVQPTTPFSTTVVSKQKNKISKTENCSDLELKLVIWESYKKYFAYIPLEKAEDYFMGKLYKIITCRLNPAKFQHSEILSCSVCNVKIWMLDVYFWHIELISHMKNVRDKLVSEQKFGLKDLRLYAMDRRGFCELCVDTSWDTSCKDHVNSEAHIQRRTRIKKFIAKEAEPFRDSAGADAQKFDYRDVQRFRGMIRDQIETIKFTQPEDLKFTCKICCTSSPPTFDSLSSYIEHVQSPDHMRALFFKISTFYTEGFGKFVRINDYNNLRYFCEICPIRQPASTFEPNTLQKHLASAEHKTNVQILSNICLMRDSDCKTHCLCPLRMSKIVDDAGDNNELSDSKVVKDSSSTCLTAASEVLSKAVETVKEKCADEEATVADQPEKLKACLIKESTGDKSTASGGSIITHLTSGQPSNTTSLAPHPRMFQAEFDSTTFSAVNELGGIKSEPEHSSTANLMDTIAGPNVKENVDKSSHLLISHPLKSENKIVSHANSDLDLQKDLVKKVEDESKSPNETRHMLRRSSSFSSTSSVSCSSSSKRSRKKESTLKKRSHKPKRERSRSKIRLGHRKYRSKHTRYKSRGSESRSESRNSRYKSKHFKYRKRYSRSRSRTSRSRSRVSRSRSRVSRSRSRSSRSRSRDSRSGSRSSKYRYKYQNRKSKYRNRKSRSRSRKPQHRSRGRSISSGRVSQSRSARSRSISSSSRSRGAKSRYRYRYRKSRSTSKSAESSDSSLLRMVKAKSPSSESKPKAQSFVNFRQANQAYKRSTLSPLSPSETGISKSPLGDNKSGSSTFNSVYKSTTYKCGAKTVSLSAKQVTHQSTKASYLFSKSKKSNKERDFDDDTSQSNSPTSQLISSSFPFPFKSTISDRYTSPPVFKFHQNSTFCPISSEEQQLALRSLSPMSSDVVSQTVKNAWRFYCARFHDSQSFSSDIVLQAQLTYLKSYSGFFAEDPKFENLFPSLLKPCDLKDAMQKHLKKYFLTPEVVMQARAASSTESSSITAWRQEMIQDIMPSKSSNSNVDAAVGMKSLIQAGNIPQLSINGNNVYECSPVSIKEIPKIENLGSPKTHTNICPGDVFPSFNMNRSVEIPFLNDSSEYPPPPASLQKSHLKVNENLSHAKSSTPELPAFPITRKSDGFEKEVIMPNNTVKNVERVDVESFPDQSMKLKERSEVIESMLVNCLYEEEELLSKASSQNANTKADQSLTPSTSLQDDMCVFISKIIEGIIRMTSLLEESELRKEQQLMHSRMVTSSGHMLIKMAQCQLNNPQMLASSFPAADAEAINMLAAIDERVIELIAGTPLLDS